MSFVATQTAASAKKDVRPLRVMHITSVEKPNYYLNNLADFTSRDTVEFSVCTTGKDLGFIAELQWRGVQGRALDSISRAKTLSAYVQTLAAIRDLDPDIVHTHLFEPSLLGVRAARKLKKKVIVTRHHSDAIHRLKNPLKRAFYQRLESYLSDAADLIIAPSQMVRETLLKEGADAAKIRVIPYGQRLDRFNLDPARVANVRAELRMEQGVALVCVSRLFHEKGHRFLFEAFAELVQQGLNAKLFLVGTGDFEPSLRECVKKLAIESSVVFFGWRDDALYVMAAADCVVHPSLQEALPSAVIEACMLEKPLVVSDVSGVRDITAGHASIVPPGDVARLKQALSNVLADLPAAKSEASLAKAHILEYMDPQRVADAYLECYREVLAQGMAR
jgi:glycosyltransferase involved in cell wall biosynthesis